MSGTLGPASIPLLGCALLLVVLVLQIVSFATPHWATDEDDTSFGLWRYAKCKEQSPDRKCFRMVRTAHVAEWFNAVRGLECLAIIFWALPVMVIPVYLYVALGLYYRCILVSMTIFNLLGTICNIAGVVIFGIKLNDKSDWDMGWCFIIAAIAGAIGIVAFIVFAVACCNRPVFAPKLHLASGFYVEPDRNRMYVIENFDDEKPGPLAGGHVNPAMSG